jgi:hypothetical protein
MSVAIATMGKFIPSVGTGTGAPAAAPFSGGGFAPPQPRYPIIRVTFLEEDEEYPFAVVTDITNGINGEA